MGRVSDWSHQGSRSLRWYRSLLTVSGAWTFFSLHNLLGSCKHRSVAIDGLRGSGSRAWRLKSLNRSRNRTLAGTLPWTPGSDHRSSTRGTLFRSFRSPADRCHVYLSRYTGTGYRSSRLSKPARPPRRPCLPRLRWVGSSGVMLTV